MATMITCPSCKHSFALEEVMTDDIRKELRAEMIAYKSRKDEEVKQLQEQLSRKDLETMEKLTNANRLREEEYQKKISEFSKQASLQQENFEKKLADEKKLLQQSLEASLRKSISGDFENQLSLLTHANKENEERLRASRQKELEYMQREQELKTKESEWELSLQRKLQDERTKISDEIRKIEEQKMASKETEYNLRLKEMEKQLEDQKKLAEEMKRRADQGSMQLQGEVQELALEELLRMHYPMDEIREVSKGKRGADCVQIVRNPLGQECGKIIYESKRAEHFGGDWVEKLKTDMRSQGAHFAILVTKTMPRDMESFGERGGVWICSFSEVRALSYVLRDGILRIFQASKSQENKGDKVQLLYDYLTSNEFAEQWKAIREGFLSMKNSIQRERDAMEKLWKSREKQLEKVLLNAVHIKGSVEGIAGNDSISLNLIDDGTDDLQLD
ncbi:MAG: DUF2130 domain-containing protein [Chitinophagales bacterium]